MGGSNGTDRANHAGTGARIGLGLSPTAPPGTDQPAHPDYPPRRDDRGDAPRLARAGDQPPASLLYPPGRSGARTFRPGRRLVILRMEGDGELLRSRRPRTDYPARRLDLPPPDAAVRRNLRFCRGVP